MARRAPSVSGRLIAITGAARGIGLATAELLASRGALLALGDLDGQLAADKARELGNEARGYDLDVTSTESFAGFLEHVETDFARPLDVLVNNAGIMWVGSFEEETEAAALRQMDVNFHGTARGMRLAVPRMRAAGSGQIVNVASAASKLPSAGEATYSATKHAVYGYSLAVREELRGTGIEISLVMPAVVETELAAGTSHGRTRRLAPRDVARAVLGAIERPRFEIYVPQLVGPWARLMALAPQRLRDQLYASMMPNQLKQGDASLRANYEERWARLLGTSAHNDDVA